MREIVLNVNGSFPYDSCQLFFYRGFGLLLHLLLLFGKTIETVVFVGLFEVSDAFVEIA